MGQKVHPFGFRLGVHEDWRAHWFAKNGYGKALMEDFAIRGYLANALSRTDTARVIIDKAGENLRIVIFSARPGTVIGKKGHGIEGLKKSLYDRFKKNVEISVQEVKNVDLDAAIVAQSIAEQLERRASFKRVMKKVAHAALKAGAKGIKICCAGRLGGAEIARSEWVRLGSVPLHTLRSDVSYSLAEAKTTYGMIGVKVWICRGEYSS
ncbi:30S ribosomal protein S3 [Candidatus Dependentiae bacterium]|nr:30S ribosomal protein S3 [Candidatus Dependentiae bacterium]